VKPGADLGGRWALVTGSSRGIGQQIALGLAEHGCNLILHARALENLEETGSLLMESGVERFCVAGDVGTPEGRSAIVTGVRLGPSSGQVDILYNNAGIMSAWTPLFETPLEEWQGTFAVNLYGTIELCRAFVPGMVERSFGRVINLSSGIKDTPHLSPYSVSKAAVDKYTQDLAAELKGTNVLANLLDPDWLRTNLGGPDAPLEVETVLPGALVPALLDDFGPSGQVFAAQDYRDV
jgi:NAD(P)-dependent dehydrogenase (short-subunit alcohol dehydrogenase family)